MGLTLGEGGTPLLPAPRLSERLGAEIWLKWEGANPTGSFKDRGMAIAVGRAVERGATGVVCASPAGSCAPVVCARAARVIATLAPSTSANVMRRDDTDIACGSSMNWRRRRAEKQSGPALVSESGPAVRVRSGQYPVNMDMGS